MTISAAPFVDEYSELSVLTSRSPDELRRQDASNPPRGRWIISRDGLLTGAVTARDRPDRRTFLSFVGRARADHQILARAATEDLDGDLFATVYEKDREEMKALLALDFEIEHVFEKFRIEFTVALHKLRRAGVPTGFRIVAANSADMDALFQLDNEIRQDIPGTEGWVGQREWILDELASPHFDPAAYLVAIHESNGAYAGLVRVWRNEDGPRLGLVGVLPPYRRTTVASALLRQSLGAASTWGAPTFTAETSPSNPVIYRRMGTLGAQSLGRFFQLVRPKPPVTSSTSARTTEP